MKTTRFPLLRAVGMKSLPLLLKLSFIVFPMVSAKAFSTFDCQAIHPPNPTPTGRTSRRTVPVTYYLLLTTYFLLLTTDH